jgi:hypothetical protein
VQAVVIRHFLHRAERGQGMTSAAWAAMTAAERAAEYRRLADMFGRMARAVPDPMTSMGMFSTAAGLIQKANRIMDDSEGR